jgi:hypothetical protein
VLAGLHGQVVSVRSPQADRLLDALTARAGRDREPATALEEVG